MVDIGNLAILVGKNGSGKTNILETLSLFFNDFQVTGGISSTVFNSNDAWYRKRPSGVEGGGAIEVTLKLKLDNKESEILFQEEKFLKILKNNYNKIDICRQLKNPATPWITKYIKFGNHDIVRNDKIITAEEFNISAQRERLKKNVIEEITAYFFHPIADEPDFSKEHLILLKKKAYPTSRYSRKLIIEGKIPYKIIPDKDFHTWVVEKELRIIKNPIKRNLITGQKRKPSIILTDENIEEITTYIESLVKVHFIYIQANRDVKSMPDTRVTFIDQELIINPFCKLNYRDIPAEDEVTYRKILGKIKKFIAGDLQMDQSPNEISYWEGGNRYSLKSLGGGIQVIIGFMYQIYSAPKNSIFAIEEPEIHLHSDFSRILFDLFKEEAEVNQIILTTHLPKFIDQTIIKNNWKVSKENSNTEIKRLQSKKNLVEILDDLGARPVDRLYPNKILLACKTERTVLSILAENLRYKMDGVLFPLLESDWDKRSIKIHADFVKDTQTTLVLLLDEHGKENANEALKKGYVKKENCFVLDGTIEDYYPTDILVKILKDLFGVEVSVEELEKPVVTSIQKISGIPKKWKIPVAEAVAEKWMKNIPDALEEVLKKLDS